ncbi:hypothetical protein PAPYR_5412 [Paratrimastix pyriformis]|uniref:Uncharacterized protein n=1 Tax=Paratrimastix pyriformis TaxID=342808 RepID=A0ABQ8UI19_9EUKA|nr:hypothetical protein PAPYR_5412 [Paratrimastix pyriformis]
MSLEAIPANGFNPRLVILQLQSEIARLKGDSHPATVSVQQSGAFKNSAEIAELASHLEAARTVVDVLRTQCQDLQSQKRLQAAQLHQQNTELHLAREELSQCKRKLNETAEREQAGLLLVARLRHELEVINQADEAVYAKMKRESPQPQGEPDQWDRMRALLAERTKRIDDLTAATARMRADARRTERQVTTWKQRCEVAEKRAEEQGRLIAQRVDDAECLPLKVAQLSHQRDQLQAQLRAAGEQRLAAMERAEQATRQAAEAATQLRVAKQQLASLTQGQGPGNTTTQGAVGRSRSPSSRDASAPSSRVVVDEARRLQEQVRLVAAVTASLGADVRAAIGFVVDAAQLDLALEAETAHRAEEARLRQALADCVQSARLAEENVRPASALPRQGERATQLAKDLAAERERAGQLERQAAEAQKAASQRIQELLTLLSLNAPARKAPQ